MMTDAELTRLLAERVMGGRIWKETEHQGDHDWLDNPANYPHLTEFNTGAFILWCAPNENGRLWRPLDSMDDAWMLVERMRKLGWSSSHTDLTVDSGTAWWSWHFCQFAPPPAGASESAQAPTPQRAIALAALRAVGVEVE